MPEDAAEFISVCNSLESEGGGDEPESCLEAIGYAIQSDLFLKGRLLLCGQTLRRIYLKRRIQLENHQLGWQKT